ncbi:hypothetical protein [Bacillus sp. NEB1478]|uniref:hypothetical protein n=1 Tax=Bacillus sp. NEB1478 TaxID=3073816 RepID=UPI002872F9B1|nr:hypothetical protein [Bacillus sp. NEB1478]WNB92721.1 hypothetical protein RGB74_03340 [Bacillus sp. NEB1478]
MTQLLELENTLLELINNLEIRASSIQEVFLQNDISDGLNRVLIFTEDLTVLTEGLAAIDPNQNKFIISDINAKMNEIINAIELQDPLFVADILGQEIMPILSYWKELLS